MSNTPIMFRPTDSDLRVIAAVKEALTRKGLTVNTSDVLRYGLTLALREEVGILPAAETAANK
jgi:Arc/MetJ-type ribon-helix-helix transcriptional regulator